MNAEAIRIESDDRGFELHIDTTEDGTFVFNIHGLAPRLHELVKAEIGPWLAEGEAARREFESGVADDPNEQALLDSIKDPERTLIDRLNETLLEDADTLRDRAREK